MSLFKTLLFVAMGGIFILPLYPSVTYCLSITLALYSAYFLFFVRPLSSFVFVSYAALFLIGVPLQLWSGIELSDQFGSFSESTVLYYHVLANGFLLLLVIVVFFSVRNRSSWRPLNEGVYTFSISSAKQSIWVGLAMMAVAVGCFVIDYGGVSSIASMSRVDLGLNRSVLSIIGLYLAYMTVPLYFLLGVVLRVRSSSLKQTGIWFSILCAVFSLFLFFVFRIRTFLVTHAFAFGFGLLLAPRFVIPGAKVTVSKVRIPFIVFVSFGLLACLAVVLVRFQRGNLFEAGEIGNIDMDFLTLAFELSIVGGDIGYHTVVMRVIELVDKEVLNVTGDSYLRLILALFPSGVFDFKPVDPQVVLGAIMAPELSGHTVPPGLIGDAYINVGHAWPVVAILFMLIFDRLDKKRDIRWLLFFAGSFSTIFHLVRGAFANAIIILVVLYFGAHVFSRMARLKVSRY